MYIYACGVETFVEPHSISFSSDGCLKHYMDASESSGSDDCPLVSTAAYLLPVSLYLLYFLFFP